MYFQVLFVRFLKRYNNYSKIKLSVIIPGHKLRQQLSYVTPGKSLGRCCYHYQYCSTTLAHSSEGLKKKVY